MKIRNYPPHFNIILIINCIIFILSFSANAQKNKDIIALLDTSAFKGKLLLNNAVRFDKFFDPFREKIKKVNANKEIVLDLPAEYFNYLSDILEQADLKQKPLNDKLKNIIGRKGNEITKNNVIPISIINSEAILLTKEQVVANQEAKKINKKADSKDYETIRPLLVFLFRRKSIQPLCGVFHPQHMRQQPRKHIFPIKI